MVRFTLAYQSTTLVLAKFHGRQGKRQKHPGATNRALKTPLTVSVNSPQWRSKKIPDDTSLWSFVE